MWDCVDRYGAGRLPGAVAVKQAGGHVIAQDEASSVVWGMPGSTVKADAAHQVLALTDIADAVITWRAGR